MDSFYFENTQGNHNKFWAIELTGNHGGDDGTIWKLTRRWGQIGQEGRTMIESYDCYNTAEITKDRLIKEKIVKGYESVL